MGMVTSSPLAFLSLPAMAILVSGLSSQRGTALNIRASIRVPSCR